MSQLDDIVEKLNCNNIFLTGGAGVGKSYITNQIIKEYRDKGRGVVALGSTGVSAVNIGGFTIHSFFIFGIANNFDELAMGDRRAKKRLSDLKKILKATNLIIIDEISMVSTNLMDMIAYRLSSLGYRGRLLLVGDFFQLPPIQKNQKKGDLFRESLYAFESSAWEKLELEVVELTQMMRSQDREFTDILQKVREGICDLEVVEYITKLSQNSSVDTIEPTYLYGRNLEVEETNRMKLDQLDSDETIIFSHLDIFGNPSEKRLSSWRKLLPISDQLTLKEGVPILFTVNKWGKFVNGERGILRTIEDEYLIVEKSDEFVRVERHEFDLLDMVVKPDGTIETISLATLSQFPLKLAYAVTIHKSQGMSIERLVCNVDNIFAPSQFYVAISRAIDPKTLKIEFSKGDLSRYLHRVISVDDRVVEYYK